jgi:hypothetical protein
VPVCALLCLICQCPPDPDRYADILGVEIEVAGAAEGCALGAAVCAAVCAGAFPSTVAAQAVIVPAPQRVHAPDPAAVAVYNELFGWVESHVCVWAFCELTRLQNVQGAPRCVWRAGCRGRCQAAADDAPAPRDPAGRNWVGHWVCGRRQRDGYLLCMCGCQIQCVLLVDVQAGPRPRCSRVFRPKQVQGRYTDPSPRAGEGQRKGVVPLQPLYCY